MQQYDSSDFEHLERNLKGAMEIEQLKEIILAVSRVAKNLNARVEQLQKESITEDQNTRLILGESLKHYEIQKRKFNGKFQTLKTSFSKQIKSLKKQQQLVLNVPAVALREEQYEKQIPKIYQNPKKPTYKAFNIRGGELEEHALRSRGILSLFL